MQQFLRIVLILLSMTLYASNNPIISLGPQSVEVTEGDSGSVNAELNITISEAPDTNSITITYATVAAVAEDENEDNDFISNSGTITFNVGDAAVKTISFTVNSDTTSEGDEYFLVQISASSDADQTYTIENNESNITILNDDTVADGGGSTLPVLPDSNAPCDIFSNVLTTYEFLDVSSSANIQACYTDAISYPSGNISGTVMCDETSCSGGVYSCTRNDPPPDRYYTTFPTNSHSGTAECPAPASLSALEYGDITYTSTTTVTLAPSNTYQNFNRPVMLLGDIVFKKNNNTLNFYPGDYYIDSLTFQKSGNTVNLPSGGVVRLFIQGDFSVDLNSLSFNMSGSASNIFVYVGGDFVSIGNGGGTTSFRTYMYVKGNVELNNNSNNWKMYGGITAEGSITITGNNPDFIQDGNPDNFGMGSCVESTYLYGPFDAWDTFRSIENPQISTKVAGSTFSLTLASLNDSRNAYETKEGVSVTYWLYDTTAHSMIPSTQGVFNASNAASTETFATSSAYRETAVQFRLCSLYDGSVFTPFNDMLCSDYCTTATNKTVPCFRILNATDTFAIRPDHFTLELSPSEKIKAGNDFSITVSANSAGSAVTPGYNEVFNDSFTIDYEETNPSCIRGTLDIPDFAFSDGTKVVTGTTYDETGLLHMTLKEKDTCSERFAAVDCSDTATENFNPSSDTLITAAELNDVSFIPDRFEIDETLLSNRGANFTYLSDNLDHASTLALTIRAVNLAGITTKNYTQTCYATPTVLRLDYDTLNITPADVLSHTLYKETKTALSGSAPLNQPMQLDGLPETAFEDASEGETDLMVLINFDRTKTHQVNPFELNITTVTFSDENGITGTASPSQKVKYLYGRAHIPRYVTEGATATTAVYYEFYCDSNCNIASHSGVASHAKQSSDSIWWYINESHNTTNDGNITATQTRNAYLNGDFITMTPTDSSSKLSYIYKEDKGYPYKVSAELSTQAWLLENQFDESSSNNYFELEFYNTDSQKSGTDNDIKTVELNASKKRNWRLMW